jgi:hypothetical protein
VLTKYFSGDKIKKNEMGKASSMYEDRRDADMILVRKLE